MQRFRRSLTAFDPTQVHMLDNLSSPNPRIVKTPLLRSQVHSPPKGIGDCFDEVLTIHLHGAILP
jgi:hypothetical protein